jgi:hypothetical protein
VDCYRRLEHKATISLGLHISGWLDLLKGVGNVSAIAERTDCSPVNGLVFQFNTSPISQGGGHVHQLLKITARNQQL